MNMPLNTPLELVNDPVEQARVGQFTDIGDLGGVGEEFHDQTSLRVQGDLPPDSGCAQ